MNAPCFPPFPANPSVGQICGGWCWNGSAWVPSQPTSGGQVLAQVFLASGAYMPSPGLTTCLAQCIGPGGAGGYVHSLGAFTGAGGGGSGGRSIKAIPAALVMGGVVVTVGTGNEVLVGNVAGAGVYAGDTSFGALCVAHGGQNAFPFDHSRTPAYNGDGGNGAPVGIGDVFWPGSAGHRWVTCEVPAAAPPYQINAIGGLGGTIVGGNNQASNQFGSQGGTPGYFNTGAGGSGAESNGEAADTERQGGRGSDGIVIVLEFCFGQGGMGGDCGCAPIPITDNSCIGWGPGWQR